MVLHALHLCSGYGGFELGLKLAGIATRTVCHVERDSHAAAALVARMEEQALDLAPIWSDLATFDPEPWVGRVDIITAGFPCQPFSVAGHQRGVDDERWLWPGIERIVEQVGPGYVFLENVPGLIKRGLPHVLDGLAQLGFDAEWDMFSAREAGAPHERRRVWILAWRKELADTTGARREEQWGAVGGNPELARPHLHRDRVHRAAALHRFPPYRNDLDGWAEYVAQGGPEPGIRRSTDGRPAGLADSLHLGGNGLVPFVAAGAILALEQAAGIRLPRQGDNDD